MIEDPVDVQINNMITPNYSNLMKTSSNIYKKQVFCYLEHFLSLTQM